jgi:O-antigen/teichoic acid export membrane protein
MLGNVFNVPDDLSAELKPILPWLALAVPMLTLEGVLTGTLTGREKFLTLNLRAILGITITQLLPLLFIWLIEPTLTVAIAATLLARAINVSIFVVVAFRSVPASLLPRWGGLKTIRELTSYGGWISLSALLGPLLTALDRFLIAIFLTPVAVTLYAVPYQLVTRGGLFSRALANAMFPRLARLGKDDARQLTRKAMRANAALMLVLCTAGMIIMRPFLTLWVGTDFADQASQVGEQLVITVWLTAIGVILRNAIEADGRPQEIVKIMVLQALPYAVLGAAGLIWIGILGVAIARNGRSLMNLLLMARSADFMRETVNLLGVPAIIFATLLVVLNLDFLGLELRLIGAVAIWLIAVAWANHLFPEGRAMVLGAIRKRFT